MNRIFYFNFSDGPLIIFLQELINYKRNFLSVKK